MRMRVISLAVLSLAVFSFGSARGADQPNPAPVEPSTFFIRDVMPLVNRLGCNQVQCHGSDQGKGGMALSLFGAEPEEDYETFVKSDGARRVNRVEPAKSLLLLKPTATIAHGGGQKIQPGSPEFKLLLAWVSQGAPWSDEKLPKLVAVRIALQEQVLQKGQTQQLAVSAVFSDNTQTDVTRLASFRSTEVKVATVDADGKVKAEDFGQSVIVATYLRQFAVLRTLVPQPLPSPFPAVQPNNRIDELVFAKLKTLGIPPSEVCTDEVFLRRVFLDAIGTLPTPEEARAFLSDADLQKRSKLIDRLLERPEFVDFWTLKWSDLLRVKGEAPVNLWPKGAETYYRWIRESIAQNKPYDQFVRELLTSSGSSFRDGAANYFRAVDSKDPRTFAETTAVVFMGVRMACARCHGHPLENWGSDDDLGLAAFFAQVGYKPTSEWKEEIVYRCPKQELQHPKTRVTVKPKFLGGACVELDKEADPRLALARWLTAPENPWFAKSIVNRIWFWLLGRGIVHEPDDLRTTNPPENPELLEYLEKELVGHRYDLKHIYRLVLNSKTYQLSSKPTALNEKDFAHFSHYQMKRLAAEQVLDALCQITEAPYSYRQFSRMTPAPVTQLPTDTKATKIADGSADSGLLALFGRPPRATPYERERGSGITMSQVLFFLKSDSVEGSIAGSPLIQRLLAAKKSDAEIVEELSLVALSRFPKQEEKQKLTLYLQEQKNDRINAIRNVLWALLNTVEFLFNH